METLGNIAKSLTIGALDALQTMLSFVTTIRLTGGVSVYTVTHNGINGYDLRSSNLVNNFGNGMTLRADKAKIKSTNAYVYDEEGKLGKPVIYSDYIGRLYHQDDFIESSSFSFITEEGFGKFESAIRNENLRNITEKSEEYSNASHTDYGAIFLGGDFSRTVSPMKIGDEYVQEKSIIVKHNDLKKDANIFYKKLHSFTEFVDSRIGETEESEKYLNLSAENAVSNNGVANVSNGHEVRTYESGNIKDIKRFGIDYFNGNIEGKGGLSRYRINYDYIKKFPPYNGIKVNGRSYLEHVDIPDYIIDLSFLKGPISIVDFYNDARTKNINESIHYTYSNPYAVGNSGDMLRFYNVGMKKSEIGQYSEIKITNGKGDPNSLLTKSTYSELESKNDTIKDKSGPFVGDSGYSKLIHKTNDMFKQMKIGSLVNRFHMSSTDLHDYDNDELVTSKSNYGLSRGRNLLANGASIENGYHNPYCRVWTKHHQYTKLSRLIRPFNSDSSINGISDIQRIIEKNSELRPNNGGSEYLANNTVLMNNGFVRMSSQHSSSGVNDITNFMFSIENLAWRDIELDGAGISKEQQGPNKGRIMWFPPYNLKFTENVNVDWNANKFIGRGEQIYTYTNTDRSGTLSFTLLIDHPSIINVWRGTSQIVDDAETRENEILRFFAGCSPLDNQCNPGIDKKTTEEPEKRSDNNPKYNGETRNVAIVLFFPNNFSANDLKNEPYSKSIELLRKYENGNGDWDNRQDSDIENIILPNNNESLYYLNNVDSTSDENDIVNEIRTMLFGGDENIEFYGFFNRDNGYDKLNDIIKNMDSEDGVIFGDKKKNIKIDGIELGGFASSHGTQTNNQKLSKRRADFLKNVLVSKNSEINPELFSEARTGIKEVFDISSDPMQRDINTIQAKVARSAYALFRIRWEDETTTPSVVLEDGNIIVENQDYDNFNAEEISKNILVGQQETTVSYVANSNELYRADNEYLYFSGLRDDEVAYQRVIDKIKYFNPAFHSITPEGFNARLTFLHQCTRQGPTVDLSSGLHNSESTNYTKYAGNMSFGRAPYCILRIGDFFHTKICITSLSIDYDSGGGVQWDLNPEGTGVQPMYANININFNFIGGQDLAGPIERLQNAVTSNYYANASVYDNKADRKGKYVYDVRLNNPEKPEEEQNKITEEDVQEEQNKENDLGKMMRDIYDNLESTRLVDYMPDFLKSYDK